MTARPRQESPPRSLGDHWPSHDDDLVEAIARRVVELLRDAGPVAVDTGEPALWTTDRVAAELGRSAEWVRDHRGELGVVTTAGARPRLLFDRAAVRAWATARAVGRGASDGPQAADRPQPRAPRASRRPPSGNAHALLPIRGEKAA